MDLHWHRRDLRLADNLALAAADSPVLGVFVVDEGVHRHASPPRMAALLDALESLRGAYRERGSELIVRQGAPETVLPSLVDRLDGTTVTAAAEYSGLARRRDERVVERLEDVDAALATSHDAVLVPPGEITTNAGDPYSVFSYYAKKWHDRAAPDPASVPLDALAEPSALPDLEPGPIPTLAALDFPAPEAAVPPVSTAAARERLREFVAEAIFRYEDRRDLPAEGGTSRLSPHLRFGTIGIREVTAATDEALDRAETEAARESVLTFRDQLAWRDFYAEQLFHHPEMVRTNLTTFENPIEWERDDAAFAAWCAGETGYPIVDAGMRQLREEAWMHNRVRMIVASFLTKDLRIDWRRGYRWFREKLVDHDPGNDAGGWQWAASTGTDAQPFFRIFNPASQAETHDPDGEYVREYVPELRDVPTEVIHDWPTLETAERAAHAPAYPAPIVDHAAAREAALAMFRAARGEDR